ncbi:Hypothetical predicted protein [Olea europaea subsp. europaea]|uniref:Uncharacterized protein n=1 Tax=Olea europaea subsp. europaea TaxID=158383 RepID=A0A8S0Q1P2_OLEEU|nr:Hypothetical predicted protein [Olea europaea subsp. europaea]
MVEIAGEAFEEEPTRQAPPKHRDWVQGFPGMKTTETQVKIQVQLLTVPDSR